MKKITIFYLVKCAHFSKKIIMIYILGRYLRKSFSAKIVIKLRRALYLYAHYTQKNTLRVVNTAPEAVFTTFFIS
jgi:hypothetical protein